MLKSKINTSIKEFILSLPDLSGDIQSSCTCFEYAQDYMTKIKESNREGVWKKSGNEVAATKLFELLVKEIEGEVSNTKNPQGVQDMIRAIMLFRDKEIDILEFFKDEQEGRYYIKIDYTMKESLKKAIPSAKWNPEKRLWYVGTRSGKKLEAWAEQAKSNFDVCALQSDADAYAKKLSESFKIDLNIYDVKDEVKDEYPVFFNAADKSWYIYTQDNTVYEEFVAFVVKTRKSIKENRRKFSSAEFQGISFEMLEEKIRHLLHNFEGYEYFQDDEFLSLIKELEYDHMRSGDVKDIVKELYKDIKDALAEKRIYLHSKLLDRQRWNYKNIAKIASFFGITDQNYHEPEGDREEMKVVKSPTPRRKLEDLSDIDIAVAEMVFCRHYVEGPYADKTNEELVLLIKQGDNDANREKSLRGQRIGFLEFNRFIQRMSVEALYQFKQKIRAFTVTAAESHGLTALNLINDAVDFWIVRKDSKQFDAALLIEIKNRYERNRSIAEDMTEIDSQHLLDLSNKILKGES